MMSKIEEIAKARAYSEGLLRSMAEALLVFDMKGKLIDVNDAWLAMMSLKREESTPGHSWTCLLNIG